MNGGSAGYLTSINGILVAYRSNVLAGKKKFPSALPFEITVVSLCAYFTDDDFFTAFPSRFLSFYMLEILAYNTTKNRFRAISVFGGKFVFGSLGGFGCPKFYLPCPELALIAVVDYGITAERSNYACIINKETVRR
ncbi:hypothetical protein CDAR_595841 [Caerostris darwini]|uniref:LAGLIDADG homing endonuclease n=1 Tax=Caerostris darwini TaxID=1538125 RepID=A0AAV4Q6D3_9ARAC|nr:hypothetical protein CDAR_595841 [Caerostris darwini]